MFTITAIQKSDETKEFDCGDIELNLFFQKYAKQNQYKHYIGATYVLRYKGELAGYVSVSSGSIKADLLNEEDKKRLPNYPLPIIRVTRLAVDKRYHKRGFGKMLLRFVLDLSVEQKIKVGCIGVVVDAKKESVEFYKKYGFKTIEVISGKLDVRPYLTTMYLSIKTIQKAKNLS